MARYAFNEWNPHFQLLTADERSNFHVLCEDCQYSIQYIGLQVLNENSHHLSLISHHAKPEDFHKAALQECAICRALWHKLSVSQQARVLSLNSPSDCPILTSMNMTALPAFEADVDKLGKSGPETAAICVYFPDTSGNDLDSDLDLDGLDNSILSTVASFVLYPATTIEDHHEQLPAGNSTWCAQSINLALGWIRECTKHHSRCALMIESPQWYPTRLIEVGGMGKLPCLIVSSEHSPTGPYFTLSHCWGKASILQLTADTLPSFKDGIALRDLPKTFEHALLVARELQVEYIWIDSLCIVQDDPEDWLHESALMHKIYSNAMCNIGATGAVDSSEGLFFERDPSYMKPVRTRFLYDVTREFKGLYDISEVDFWKDAVLEAPLNRRGWVCQERLLAPRILHFGKNQLLWECCVMEAAEKYPHGLPAAMLHEDPNIGLKRRFVDSWINSRQTNQLASPTIVSGVKLWNDIISAFSSTFLTQPSDKIVALSGMAKWMKELLHDEYVAGLWRNNLVPQLLWKVKDCKQSDGSPSNRPSGYRAPSFSWASIDGVIVPLIDPSDFEVTGTALLDILEISTRPKTNDETGILERAHLRVAGTLKQLQLQRVVRGDRGQMSCAGHASGPSMSKAMNTVMIVNGKVLREATQEDWQTTLSTPSVHLDVDQDSFEGQTNLYCVNIFKDRSLYGLLLESIPYLPGTFRRLGVYTVWWYEPELMEIMLEHDENEEPLQSESYDLVKRKHVFRLI